MYVCAVRTALPPFLDENEAWCMLHAANNTVRTGAVLQVLSPLLLHVLKGRESLLSKSSSSPFAIACGIVQQLSQRHLDTFIALQHHCGYSAAKQHVSTRVATRTRPPRLSGSAFLKACVDSQL